MILPSILDFLSQRIGLEAQSVGLPNIEAAVQERMRSLDLADIALYRDRLLREPGEQEALIEQIVVSETWFFRDQTPFNFLAVNARKQWGDFSAAAPLRILSLPCSTGEEPYSIAMTLLDAGFPSDSFQIDAVDVSAKAIAHARAATYTLHDFRGKNLDVLQRHFIDVSPDTFQLLPRVQHTVRFHHGTVLHLPFPTIPASYHAIFCRNLLIYLNHSWRQRAVTHFQHLLRPDGILFIGHADAFSDLTAHFAMARNAAAFAYYPKTAPTSAPPTQKPVQPPPPPHSPPKPNLATILHDMHLAIEEQDPNTALNLSLAALEHGRNNPELYYLLGAAHELQNNPEAAKDALQKTLYLHPRHLNALHRLKGLLEKEGDHAAVARLEARIRRVQTSLPST